jgi:Zn-finger nucleic acid-binding protein
MELRTVRVLVACHHCSAQYDVSGHKSGDNLHCTCGTVFRVPVPRLQEARLVRCPGCGAARGKSDSKCEFCDARFSAVDKGWGSMCPACYCRLPTDANFCVECGVKINAQKLEEKKSTLPCPRCKTALHGRMLEQIEMQECNSCAGVWLAVETFESICKSKDVMTMATRGLASGKRARKTKFELTEAEEVKYVPCPKCKSLMNRRNFGRISGVIIDTCRDCGVWLDNQELGRIVQFIESGGLEKTRDFESRERSHNEKMRAKPAPIVSAGVSTDLSSFSGIGSGRSYGRGGVVAPVLARVVVEIAKAFFK